MKKADTFKIAREIIAGKWLVSDPGAMLGVALDYLGRMPVRMEIDSAELSAVLASGETISGPLLHDDRKEKKVVIVPLHGTMTKYETCFTYGTVDTARKIKEFACDDTVAGLVLDVDSGGGAVSSVAPMVEAVRAFKASGKPLIAHCDTCGSAAYWVASQCDAIYMDNALSEVGSVGAMWSLVDRTAPDPSTGAKTVTVYARESEDKNKAYREAMEGRYELAQDELSPLVKEFRNAVIAGRPSLKKEEKGVLSGAMFLAADAIGLGMADAVRTLSETVEAVFAMAEIS